MIHFFRSLAMSMLMLSAAHPALAVQNNGGGMGGGTIDYSKCGSGYGNCMEWCLIHNRTDKSADKCANQCIKYWCTGPGKGRIMKSTKPVSAPPTRQPSPIKTK